MHFVTIKQNFYAVAVIAIVSVVAIFKKRGIIFILMVAAIVGLNDFICHNILLRVYNYGPVISVLYTISKGLK